MISRKIIRLIHKKPTMACLLVCIATLTMGQYVTLEGRQFKDGQGNDFYPVVCNYLASFLYKDQDTTTLFITPDGNCDAWCYDCSDVTSCMNQMYQNFVKVKEMGFNAIRLMGVTPVMMNDNSPPKAWKITAMDYDSAYVFQCDTNTSDDFHRYILGTPFETNPTVQRLFILYDSLLVQAWKADLKVILVTGRATGDYTLDYPADYAEYLAALSKHIATVSPQAAREALFAYDLFNEPHFSWNGNTLWPSDTTGHSKQDQCNNFNLWYETIKGFDSLHLVTLGGHGFLDVNEFDPAIMKVDFYSVHFYPHKPGYDPDSLVNTMERIHGHYYWLHNNLPMPYVVGETGFRSRPYGNVGPDGSLSDQKDYAINTLNLARFYGGSGYSWWNYQDYDWGKKDCFYGLLYRNKTNYQIDEKPVVEAFRKYDPGAAPPSFTRPDNYYDPYSHEYFNPNRNHISGNVRDESGKPIKDAVVQGWTTLYKKKGEYYYEHHCTFTDINGNFTIIPYDSDSRDPNYEVIIQIIVSSPGCSRFISGWHNDSIGVNPNDVDSIVLKKIDFSFEKSLSDLILTSDKSIQAWDKINIESTIIAPGVHFEAKARREIRLGKEFHANATSQCRIYLDETFMLCEELSSGFLKNDQIPGCIAEAGTENPESLRLNFLPNDEEIKIEIYPNPSTGIFTIKFDSPQIETDGWLLSVYDAFGKNILKERVHSKFYELNMSNFPKGLYLIQFNGKKLQKTEKITTI